MPPATCSDIPELATQLVACIAAHGPVVVAFSGGVDSAVVAAAARRAVGDDAVAVLAISASLPERQRELAARVAEEIGIEFRAITTQETERAEYQRNDSQRCFFCKETLYAKLAEIQSEYDSFTILSGTNADDLGDYRPGIRAGHEAGIATPLADLGIGKSAVRKLAKHWQLSNWDLPAGPCLASRIAYGEPVSTAKLRMIDRAENFLRDAGFPELRVRLHPGMLARIEVPSDRIADLSQSDLGDRIVREFRELGFKFVSVDLEGLRSGNLNQLIIPGVATPTKS